MLTGTDHIDPDEPCWGIHEVNRLMGQPNGTRSWRRVQVVVVLRGRELAEYVTDLGNAFLWEHVPEQHLLSFGDDRVGEMMEEAARDRGDTFGREIMAEIKGNSTLWKDFFQERAEKHERVNNRSHFGPKHTKQRNGFTVPRS